MLTSNLYLCFVCGLSSFLVYFVATIALIPGSLLTLGSGFVFSSAFGLFWGVVLGTCTVFVGAASGALVSFLIARFLLREQVQNTSKQYAILQALDSALQRNRLKIFILLRLSPVVPFNALNYIGGITAVSFRDYSIALFAILPGTVLYVFLGASAGSVTDGMNDAKNPAVTISILVIGLILAFLAVWLISRYARNELNHTMTISQNEEESAIVDIALQNDVEDLESANHNNSGADTVNAGRTQNDAK